MSDVSNGRGKGVRVSEVSNGRYVIFWLELAWTPTGADAWYEGRDYPTEEAAEKAAAKALRPYKDEYGDTVTNGYDGYVIVDMRSVVLRKNVMPPKARKKARG